VPVYRGPAKLTVAEVGAHARVVARVVEENCRHPAQHPEVADVGETQATRGHSADMVTRFDDNDPRAGFRGRHRRHTPAEVAV
jgi:hypothetical protein